MGIITSHWDLNNHLLGLEYEVTINEKIIPKKTYPRYILFYFQVGKVKNEN